MGAQLEVLDSPELETQTTSSNGVAVLDGIEHVIDGASPPSKVAEDDSATVLQAPERESVEWFARVTGVVGVCLLIAGLLIWGLKPGDHRLALVVLVGAMFLAILHYYSLEDARHQGGPNKPKAS